MLSNINEKNIFLFNCCGVADINQGQRGYLLVRRIAKNIKIFFLDE